jgi:RNA polymerase sporulation-specific sigma factor
VKSTEAFLKTFQKPLTQAQESFYLRRLSEGTPEEIQDAKDILIEHNMRLVAHIAKKYQNVDEDMEELIATGSLGLIKAVRTFDMQKGRFATYACRCIDNEMLMLLRSKKKSSKEVSLYEPIGQDKEGNEIRLMDIIEQKSTDIIDEMELESNKHRMYKLMSEKLGDREQYILIMRYGLCGNEEHTQNEIGEMLGISRSYVSRIEKKALEKLKSGFPEVDST